MITEEIESLKKINYVRIAQAKNDYWVDFSKKKLNGIYIENFGYNFKIIVHANDTLDEEYYIIPFEK